MSNPPSTSSVSKSVGSTGPESKPESENASDSDSFLNRTLWHWHELAAAVTSPPPAGGPIITGVSIDSRTLKPGDLFIALAGDPGDRFFTSSPGKRDGHDFLRSAQSNGAAGMLVARTEPIRAPQLRVADTLDGLWALGRAAAKRHRGVRIAITGSSGKTTAKAFLAAALEAQAEPGSLNNFWGVPLCLARTAIDAEYAVYEIGTNQAGEIAPLSTLVKPHVAILLNVHPAHIGNFSSLQALTKEKLSISEGLESISKFVCEYDVAAAAGLAEQTVTFGEAPAATVQLLEQRGDSARYKAPGGVLSARIPGGGKHRALTLGAVIAALTALDVDPRCALDLPSSLVPKGRGDERLVRRTNGGEWVVIDDSYNANPASMAAALDALADSADSTDIPAYALIGEMLELGADAEAYHKALVDHCRALRGVYCVGSGSRVLFDALPAKQQLGYAKSADEVDIGALVAALPDKGRLLVKGSNRVFWQSGFVDALTKAISS